MDDVACKILSEQQHWNKQKGVRCCFFAFFLLNRKKMLTLSQRVPTKLSSHPGPPSSGPGAGALRAPERRGAVRCSLCGLEFSEHSFRFHAKSCAKKNFVDVETITALTTTGVAPSPISPGVDQFRKTGGEGDGGGVRGDTRSLRFFKPANVDYYAGGEATPGDNMGTVEENEAEAAITEQDLVPCTHCGRTFRPDRIEYHEKICQRARESDRARSWSIPKNKRGNTATYYGVLESSITGAGASSGSCSMSPQPRKIAHSPLLPRKRFAATTSSSFLLSSTRNMATREQDVLDGMNGGTGGGGLASVEDALNGKLNGTQTPSVLADPPQPENQTTSSSSTSSRVLGPSSRENEPSRSPPKNKARGKQDAKVEITENFGAGNLQPERPANDNAVRGKVDSTSSTTTGARNRGRKQGPEKSRSNQSISPDTGQFEDALSARGLLHGTTMGTNGINQAARALSQSPLRATGFNKSRSLNGDTHAPDTLSTAINNPMNMTNQSSFFGMPSPRNAMKRTSSNYFAPGSTATVNMMRMKKSKSTAGINKTSATTRASKRHAAEWVQQAVSRTQDLGGVAFWASHPIQTNYNNTGNGNGGGGFGMGSGDVMALTGYGICPRTVLAATDCCECLLAVPSNPRPLQRTGLNGAGFLAVTGGGSGGGGAFGGNSGNMGQVHSSGTMHRTGTIMMPARVPDR
ncbi:unnamed protein product [Amoebophrya sp. A25]|nr:unnamed protein product [Amoebophrya sp. A25]|eukprot:GSA25T00004947001.1